jgi:hypothetical protein
MHDTTPTDQGQTAMTVADAAQALGLTSDAIRARIRRGTMSGFKADDDTWRVIVDQPVDATPTDSGQTDDATPTDSGQTDDATPTGRRQTATDPLIEHMEEEIMYLRTELAQRSHELATERERSDVLQREALGRIEALTAGETVPEPPRSTETNGTGLRGLWDRVRRLWSGYHSRS